MGERGGEKKILHMRLIQCGLKFSRFQIFNINDVVHFLILDAGTQTEPCRFSSIMYLQGHRQNRAVLVLLCIKDLEAEQELGTQF